MKKNFVTTFGIIFLITAPIIPIQNSIVWGPDFVLDAFVLPEFTSEKLSIAVIALGIGFLIIGHIKDDTIKFKSIYK